MRTRAAARLLLAGGGLLIVLGSFAPEAAVLGSNLLHPQSPLPPPDRSHWVVFGECLDMLSTPDLSLDWWYYVFYAVEAAGLAYLVVAGVAIAAASFFERSRGAALAFGLFHALASLGLAAAALAVFLGFSSAEGPSGKLPRMLLLASALFGGLLLGEILILRKALRHGAQGRLAPVDAANVLPAALLLITSAALFIVLRGQPNWPAGGYLASAAGSLLAITGMALRRAPVAGATEA
jgi:hypothetical protein